MPELTYELNVGITGRTRLNVNLLLTTKLYRSESALLLLLE